MYLPSIQPDNWTNKTKFHEAYSYFTESIFVLAATHNAKRAKATQIRTSSALSLVMTSSHVPQRQTADPQALSYTSSLHQPQHPQTAGAKGDTLCDPLAMQQQLEVFVRDGLLDSAHLLGELLIALAVASHANTLVGDVLKSRTESHGGNNNREPSSADESDRVRVFHAKSYFLFAELLVTKREFKRAIVSGRVMVLS